MGKFISRTVRNYHEILCILAADLGRIPPWEKGSHLGKLRKPVKYLPSFPSFPRWYPGAVGGYNRMRQERKRAAPHRRAVLVVLIESESRALNHKVGECRYSHNLQRRRRGNGTRNQYILCNVGTFTVTVGQLPCSWILNTVIILTNA